MATSVPALFRAKPPDDCSEAYRNIFEARSERAAQAKQLAEGMWRDFHDLADSQFRARLPFDFHQRWFEMYLGASLRRAGLHVEAPKPGPDLRVVVNGRATYIEAVAPTGGNPWHADAVQEPVYRAPDGTLRAIPVPSEKITLRVADGFRRKADAYDGYRLNGHVGKSDPCIVAINLYDIPHAWADPQEFWFRALYGIGDRFAVVDREGHATTTGRQHRELLTRAGGALEDVAPLLNEDRAGVSGVLGSSAQAGSVRHPLGDDFLLMPHAAAHSPYPRGLIKRGAEIELRRAEGAEHWDVETTDYGAHAPRGPVPFAVEFNGTQHKGQWAVAGRVLSISIAGRRSDIPMQGSFDPEAAAKEIGVEILRIKAERAERPRRKRP